VTAISRILCPIDFSETSHHALEYAVAIARWYDARLALLHVWNPQVLVPVTGLIALERGIVDAELTKMRTLAYAWLQEAGSDRGGVPVIIEDGDPRSRILAHCFDWHPDLVVMGTHGATGFEHLILGSVAERVLRKAPCPVLTVPPRAQSTARLPFSRLLCAIDFSDWSLSGWELACSLADQSNAFLTAFHAIEWPWHEPPAPVLKELPVAQAKALEEFRREREHAWIARLNALVPEGLGDRAVALVAHGRAYVEIIRAAIEDHSDLIVIGVHGRGAVDIAAFGSTTNHVVRAATCPVLTLKR
jgi:nucleotide-binding universal stress UspA family protein